MGLSLSKYFIKMVMGNLREKLLFWLMTAKLKLESKNPLHIYVIHKSVIIYCTSHFVLGVFNVKSLGVTHAKLSQKNVSKKSINLPPIYRNIIDSNNYFTLNFEFEV